VWCQRRSSAINSLARQLGGDAEPNGGLYYRNANRVCLNDIAASVFVEAMYWGKGVLWLYA